MTTGLTDEGFIAPTLEEILEEIESSQRAASAIGPNVDQTETSALGQLNSIFANQVRIAWEAIEAVYNGLNPDSNTGIVQDNVAGITGTVRRAASKARTVHDANLDAGIYASGSLIIRPTGTTARSLSIQDVTSSGGSVSDIIFEAETAGLTGYTTSTVYEIASPLAGFNSITSPTAVTNGKNIESNEELRLRREIESRGAGSTTVDAIYRAIVNNESLGAETVNVYENPTDTTDANGVSPYSIECIVFGPTAPTDAQNLELAETIFNEKAGGIQTTGTQSEIVTNSQGDEYVVSFSRPVELAVKSEWNLKVNPATYNSASVKEYIASYAPLNPGEELQWSSFICQGRTAGVRDVVSMTMAEVSGSLSTSNITTTVREYITMSTGSIVLNVVT